jgi:predicted membrane protein
MKRKQLPVFIMLLAGSIASILTAVMRYDLKSFLFIVLITLVIFYILGLLLKYVLDVIEAQNVKDSLDEGEVFEKEAAEKEKEISNESQTEVKQEEGK